MRKLAVVLAVVTLLGAGHAATAANLEAGWYVKLGGVALFWIDPSTGYEVGTEWNFTTPMGSYGPFQVTQPDPLWPQRMVSVPTTTAGVAPGTGLNLYGISEIPIPLDVSRLNVIYETNYDSTHMLLEMYVQHSAGQTGLLWSEPRSGHHLGNTNVLRPGQVVTPSDLIYFKVTTVPEPASSAVLVVSLCILAVRRRIGQ